MITGQVRGLSDISIGQRGFRGSAVSCESDVRRQKMMKKRDDQIFPSYMTQLNQQTGILV